jgi:hypothetical protein
MAYLTQTESVRAFKTALETVLETARETCPRIALETERAWRHTQLLSQKLKVDPYVEEDTYGGMSPPPGSSESVDKGDR